MDFKIYSECSVSLHPLLCCYAQALNNRYEMRAYVLFLICYILCLLDIYVNHK